MKTKKLIGYVGVLLIIGWVIGACTSNDVKPTLKTDVASNQLNTPSPSSFVLLSDNASDTVTKFTWTAPDFGFQAAITYSLQADVSGGDFSNAIEVASVSNKLTVGVVTKDLNNKLLGIGLTPESASDIQLRLVSSITSSIKVYSNVVTISVTPYATSFPPIYAMGAGLKGWGPWPDNEVILSSTKYKVYETVAYLSNDTFRFFAQEDWGPTSYNYPYFTTVDANFENANDGDSNLKFVGTPGWYTISVDLNAKSVAIASTAEPVLYMMGGALNGWGPWPSAAVKMTYVNPGVFKASAAITNDIFRFFGQADWNPTSYNYLYFTTVDPNFTLNPNDGDNNFKFIGTPGTYIFNVDLNAKTVTLSQ